MPARRLLLAACIAVMFKGACLGLGEGEWPGRGGQRGCYGGPSLHGGGGYGSPPPRGGYGDRGYTGYDDRGGGGYSRDRYPDSRDGGGGGGSDRGRYPDSRFYDDRGGYGASSSGGGGGDGYGDPPPNRTCPRRQELDIDEHTDPMCQR